MKRHNKNEILAQPILLFILFGSLFVFGVDLLPFSIPNVIEVIFRFGLPALFSLRAITQLNRNNFIILLVSELFFGASYFITYISGNIVPERINLYLICTLLCCLPFAIFVAELDDYQFLYFNLRKIALLNFIIIFLYMIIKIRNVITIWGEAAYSMPAGYQMLFCLCVFANEIFIEKSNKRLLYIFLSIFSFIMILLFGSRGPIACFLLFISLKLLSAYRQNRAALIVSFILIGSFIILELLSVNITDVILNILQRINVSSRTVSAILSNNILQDSGRTDIMNNAIRLIRANLLTGTGAASDLALIGGYPHNVFLEFFIDFGLLLGSCFSIWTIKCVINSIFINEKYAQSVVGIFFACGFCMLLLSSTYLQNIYFFMFIAIATKMGNHRFRIRRIA